MKTKRINLLQNRYDYYALERLFVWLRRGVVVYSFVFLLLVLGAFAFYMSKQQDLARLENQKRLLLLSSQQQKDQEAKLLLLSKKLGYYNEFIKDDAQFVPYYNLLLEALQTSSQSGTLSQFNINKNHEVEFTIRFNTFDEMTTSFAFIESERFLKNFKTLSMANFFGLTSDQSKYELSFKGVFIDLK
jgi:hypothetical protein